MSQAGFGEAFVVAGEFNLNPPAPVSGQKVPLQQDASGSLLVNLAAAITMLTNLTQVGGAPISLGPKTSANSLPVVLATDEATLPVTSPSIVSAGNSSTTPLGSNAVFTGTATDLLPYKALSIAVFADQVGSFSVQYSEDQVNWDLTETISVVASTALTNQFTIRARYFRLVYTNGATAQGVFRLQTLLHPAPLGVRLAPVSQTVLAADEALTTHSVITGLNSGGGGSYVDVKVNPSGSLQVQDNADTTLGGTSAPAQVMVAGGKSNDSTPQYQPLPEGPGGRSVIVEGVVGGTNIPVSASGTVTANQGSATGAIGASWYTKISDGTNGPVAVKPASTAAVAADPALVVSVSPNSNAPVIGAVGPISTATWNSSNSQFSGIQITTTGMGAVVVQFQTDNGTFTGGIIRFYARVNGGTYVSIQGMRILGQGTSQLYDAPSQYNPATGQFSSYWFNVTGFDQVLVQLDAVITGTGNVTLQVRATAQTVPNPTTVGQSDPTKHRVNVWGNIGGFTSVSASATGSQATLTVPAGQRWIVKGGTSLLITSATVSNRNFNIFVADASGNVLVQSLALASSSTALNQPASTTIRYNFSPVFNYFMSAAVAANYNMPFPEVALGPGATIKTNVQSLDAADQVQLFLNVIQIPD